MRKYVEHDDSGKILRYGVCSTAEFARRKTKNDKIIEVLSLVRNMDITKKITGGKIVDKTSEEIKKGE